MAICVILIHVEMTCNLRVMCNYHKFSSNIWAMATVLTTVVMTPWINSNFTINLHTIWSNAWVGSIYYVNERLQTLGNLFKEINFNHTVLNLNPWKRSYIKFCCIFFIVWYSKPYLLWDFILSTVVFLWNRSFFNALKHSVRIAYCSWKRIGLSSNLISDFTEL